MKSKLFAALLAASLLSTNQRGFAAEKGDASTELTELVAKVQTKLKEGKKTEKDLGEDIKQFEALLARHKDEKTDEVAQILLMEVMDDLQDLDNAVKAVGLDKQLKRDFPQTGPGQGAAHMLE